MDLLLSANYASSSESESDSEGRKGNKNSDDNAKATKGFIRNDYQNEDDEEKQRSIVLPNEQDDGSYKKRKRVQFERSVPHTRGNWAGHIYAELDETSDAYLLLKKHARQHALKFQNQLSLSCSIADRKNVPQVYSHLNAEERTHSPARTDEHAGENDGEIHISLSKLFFVQQHSVVQFEKAIRQQIESFIEGIRHLLPLHVYFPLSYGSTKILCNEEGTRSFLTIPILAGENLLINLIRGAIDPVLVQFRQMPYHEQPIIHSSIASVVGCHDFRPQENLKDNEVQSTTKIKRSITTQKGNSCRSVSTDAKDSVTSSESDESERKMVVVSITSIVCSLGSARMIKIPFG